jgi:CRP/FNR family transcriptional regulator, cyclic AMP receptor protein
VVGLDAELLARIPVFRDLPAPALASIARLARVRTYPPHAIVVQQDDPSDGVYLINAGRLSVSVAAPDGRVTTIGQMGPGEIIGEISLLDGGPRSATVTALTESQLVAVERAPFLELVQSQPSICLALVAVLAQRLRALTRWADDTVGLPVPARLAKRLIALVAESGQQTGPRRFRIGVKLSQTDLGTRVGATRESVNKHLRRWEQSHILEQEAGHLVILDVERLRAIADL